MRPSIGRFAVLFAFLGLWPRCLSATTGVLRLAHWFDPPSEQESDTVAAVRQRLPAPGLFFGIGREKELATAIDHAYADLSPKDIAGLSESDFAERADRAAALFEGAPMIQSGSRWTEAPIIALPYSGQDSDLPEFRYWERRHDYQGTSQAESPASTRGVKGVVSDGFSICHAALIRNRLTGNVALFHVQGELSDTQRMDLWGAPRDLPRGLGRGPMETILVGGSHVRLIAWTERVLNASGYPVSKVIHVPTGEQHWGIAYRAATNTIYIDQRSRHRVLALDGFQSPRLGGLSRWFGGRLQDNPLLAAEAPLLERTENAVKGLHRLEAHVSEQLRLRPNLEDLYSKTVAETQAEIAALKDLSSILSLYRKSADLFAKGRFDDARSALAGDDFVRLMTPHTWTAEDGIRNWSLHTKMGRLEHVLLDAFYRLSLVSTKKEGYRNP